MVPELSHERHYSLYSKTYSVITWTNLNKNKFIMITQMNRFIARAQP